jgi:hypothetical protein
MNREFYLNLREAKGSSRTGKSLPITSLRMVQSITDPQTRSIAETGALIAATHAPDQGVSGITIFVRIPSHSLRPTELTIDEL